MKRLTENLNRPERARRLRVLILLQVLALIVFFGVTAFAVLARSLAAAIGAGVALSISFICGYMAGRLMFERKE